MIIDSHQHFWNYELPKHEWIDDTMSAIRRDFTPQMLQPILEANGVSGCVAVQADQTPEETHFLLGIADRFDFVKGVVGWVDLRSDNLEHQLDKFEGKHKLKGFRHVVQGEPDPLFLLGPSFLRGIRSIIAHGYAYDILIFPHQLVSALEFVRLFPEGKFVIDHLAKPYAKYSYFEGWAAMMTAISKYPNVYCKLSGLVTEADYDSWTAEELAPYLKHALDAFGSDRCMFGSDWPVCRVAAPYDEVLGLVKAVLGKLSDVEQSKVLGSNCADFYGL